MKPNLQAEVQKELRVNSIIETARSLVRRVSTDLSYLDNLLNELEEKDGTGTPGNRSIADISHRQQGHTSHSD